MENKVVEAVRESVESLRLSLLEELRELRSRVDQVEGKVDCVMLVAAAGVANSSRLLHEDPDNIDVGCWRATVEALPNIMTSYSTEQPLLDLQVHH